MGSVSRLEPPVSDLGGSVMRGKQRVPAPPSGQFLGILANVAPRVLAAAFGSPGERASSRPGQLVAKPCPSEPILSTTGSRFKPDVRPRFDRYRLLGQRRLLLRAHAAVDQSGPHAALIKPNSPSRCTKAKKRLAVARCHFRPSWSAGTARSRGTRPGWRGARGRS